MTTINDLVCEAGSTANRANEAAVGHGTGCAETTPTEPAGRGCYICMQGIRSNVCNATQNDAVFFRKWH